MGITRKEPANKEIQRSSSLEKCSFACHLFLFPIGVLYLSWLVVPLDLLENSEFETYYPSKEYAIHAPATALFLFLAAPFLYAAFNSLTVPDLDSPDTVGDVYTKSSRTRMSSNEVPSTRSSLPDICDMDPSTLVWHSCQDNSIDLHAS